MEGSATPTHQSKPVPVYHHHDSSHGFPLAFLLGYFNKTSIIDIDSSGALYIYAYRVYQVCLDTGQMLALRGMKT